MWQWRRIRKGCKWAFTALAVAIVIAFIATKDRGVFVDYGRWEFSLLNGCFVTRFESIGHESLRVLSLRFPGPYIWDWRFSENRMIPGMYSWFRVIPLWIILIPVVLATALLWFLDRRSFGPGLCSMCGYDRAGLTDLTKCPECGTVPT